MLSDRQYMDSNRHAGRVGFNMSVVKALMWANAIVFVLTGFGQHQATGALALGAAPIRRFEIWRLVSYMFAHGDWGHLIFNMWGVFIFGRLLEQRLGSRRFLQLYLTSGLIGGGIWLLANWGTSHFVIGASGALFGLLMAAAMAFPGLVVTLLFPPIPVRLKTLVFVYGVIEVALALGRPGSGIAHLAHLGGFLGGFVYMRQLVSSGGFSRRRGFFASIRQRWSGLQAARQRRGFQVVPDEPEPDDLAAEVDRILDKIGQSGLESLTPEERETLERRRKKLQRGR